jgi:hypothetical protein
LDGLSVLEIKEEIIRRKTDGTDSNLAGRLSKLFESEIDIKIAELVCAKVRSTVQFAAILGISEAPVVEQKKVVKRHKDRIKLKLKRAGYKL